MTSLLSFLYICFITSVVVAGVQEDEPQKIMRRTGRFFGMLAGGVGGLWALAAFIGWM